MAPSKARPRPAAPRLSATTTRKPCGRSYCAPHGVGARPRVGDQLGVRAAVDARRSSGTAPSPSGPVDERRRGSSPSSVATVVRSSGGGNGSSRQPRDRRPRSNRAGGVERAVVEASARVGRRRLAATSGRRRTGPAPWSTTAACVPLGSVTRRDVAAAFEGDGVEVAFEGSVARSPMNQTRLRRRRRPRGRPASRRSVSARSATRRPCAARGGGSRSARRPTGTRRPSSGRRTSWRLIQTSLSSTSSDVRRAGRGVDGEQLEPALVAVSSLRGETSCRRASRRGRGTRHPAGRSHHATARRRRPPTRRAGPWRCRRRRTGSGGPPARRRRRRRCPGGRSGRSGCGVSSTSVNASRPPSGDHQKPWLAAHLLLGDELGQPVGAAGAARRRS